MRTLTLITAVALLVGSLAGCLAGPASTPDETSDDTVETTASSNTTDVAAANVTEQSHVHDRWEGEVEKTLFDDTISFGPTADPNDPFDSAASLFIQERNLTLPEGEIVPPGTKQLNVTLEWSSTDPRDIDRLEFHYMPADAAEWKQTDDFSPGDQRSIPLKTEMADGGHARTTLWRFQLVHAATTPEHSTGFDVDVTIVAERVDGKLPVEPPHPDWWQDDGRRTVYDGEGEGRVVSTTAIRISGADEYLAGDEHGMIPPGTKLLVAQLNWSNSAATADASPADPSLEWTNRHGFDAWSEWEPTDEGDRSYRYTLPVESGMTDGMYAENRSRWRFDLDFRGERVGPSTPVVQDPRMPLVFDGSWELTIDALNGTAANRLIEEG